VPFTFFAHQAPMLPLARRWPRRLDGVAAVAGSLAPDVGYALEGTRMAVSAHELPALVLVGVPVTFVLAWSIVRLLAPVVPDHLPRAGPFNLPDHRGLAGHRFDPMATLCAALVALAVHVGLDHLTHDWGRPARHIGGYADPLIGGWSPMELVTVALHVGGTLLCLLLLARYGRRRWLAARAAAVAPFPTSARSHLTLWLATALGALAGAGWCALATAPRGATIMMRLALGAYLGLLAGALLLRPLARPALRTTA
jgi:hypothetical protein